MLLLGISPLGSDILCLLAFRCNGTKVAGCQKCGLVGHEFCVARSRISREEWVTNFACWGRGKAALRRGFWGLVGFREVLDYAAFLPVMSRTISVRMIAPKIATMIV